MPWTVKDVSKHKKGLSTEQKKKWVSIANSVLRECRQKNERDCDAKAIRAANSQVNANMMQTQEENMIIQSVATADYQVRSETFEGKEYLVVPVVMMVEGVHNGSRGPLLHVAEEYGRVPASWNGIPIVINHPKTQDGVYISANSPEQSSYHVGRVFNSHVEEGKLKAEAWLDVQKLTAVSQETLMHINNQSPLDVSIGSFTEEEEVEGEWNGEHYTAIAHNHRPDHLAILPDNAGACSWNDGCGIRANSSQTKIKDHEMSKEEGNNELQVLKDMHKKGFSIFPLAVNVEGYEETIDKLRTKVDSMDNETTMYFLEEVYENVVVYRALNRETRSDSLYQVNYNIAQDGNVVLEGEPRQVRREVNYVALSAHKRRRTKFSNNAKQKKMSKIKEKADALILNNNSKFTDCDREFLEGLSESKLDELMPKEEEPKPELNANTALEFLKENKPKTEDVLQLLSEKDREAHEAGLKLYQEKKEGMVKTITDNSTAWEKAELENMEFTMLEKIAKSVKPEADYSGQGAGGELSNNQDEQEEDDEFLPTMTMNSGTPESK